VLIKLFLAVFYNSNSVASIAHISYAELINFKVIECENMSTSYNLDIQERLSENELLSTLSDKKKLALRFFVFFTIKMFESEKVYKIRNVYTLTFHFIIGI